MKNGGKLWIAGKEKELMSDGVAPYDWLSRLDVQIVMASLIVALDRRMPRL